MIDIKLFQGDPPHRYVFMVFAQPNGIDVSSPKVAKYASRSCEVAGRTGFHLSTFKEDLGIGSEAEPVAANYLTVEHDTFVDSIVSYCATKF